MNGPTAEASAAVVIAKNPAKGQCLVNGIQLGVILTDYPPEQLQFLDGHGIRFLYKSSLYGIEERSGVVPPAWYLVEVTGLPPLEIIVKIDIKPNDFPNSINPKSRGVIRVAILTTDTFDATTIDPLSVRFGPDGAKETHNKGHIEDANHDGDPDLVLHFKTQATGITCGDTSASLTGETFDGDPIQGSDAIKIVGCKKERVPFEWVGLAPH
jgi:hypothetical protein